MTFTVSYAGSDSMYELYEVQRGQSLKFDIYVNVYTGSLPFHQLHIFFFLLEKAEYEVMKDLEWFCVIPIETNG